MSLFPNAYFRDILNEIQRLRKEQEATARISNEGSFGRNPTLLAELRLLRQRRDELEARMSALQESRRELMVQLEGLMKLLKVRDIKGNYRKLSCHYFTEMVLNIFPSFHLHAKIIPILKISTVVTTG